MMRHCPKCGKTMLAPRYHRDWHGGGGASLCDVPGEHLHYYCVCGYSECGPTKDAKDTPSGARRQAPT